MDVGAITLTSMDIFNQNIDFFQDDALTGKSKALIVDKMVNHTLITPETPFGVDSDGELCEASSPCENNVGEKKKNNVTAFGLYLF